MRAARGERRSGAVPLLIVVGVATVFTAIMAWPTREWSVMTDEMQTWKIALGITGGDLLPTIHEARISVRSVLYTFVLAPLVAVFDPEDAFRVSHLVNALLMSLSAVPAYLLTKRVSASPVAAVLAAVATALAPWTLLSATVLNEAVAYPAFAFAFWLCVRTIDTPSVAGDLLALVLIVAAAAARTQLIFLAALLPVAVLATEALVARRGPQPVPVRGALTRAVRRHPLLAAVVAVGALGVLGLLASGRMSSVLGTYSQTTSGSLLPSGTLKVSGVLLDAVLLGAGVLPALLAVAFVLRGLARPLTRAEAALAVLTVLFIPILLLQVGSFTMRFVEGAYPQDRYVGYAAFPLVVCAATYLAGRRPGRELLPAAVIGFWLVSLSAYGTQPSAWASPAISATGGLRDVLETVTGWIGVDTIDLDEALRLAILAAAGGLLLLARRWDPRRALLALGVPMVLLVAGQTLYAWIDVQHPGGTRAHKGAAHGEPRWIDPAAKGRDVALVVHPGVENDAWWDMEFFNERVTTATAVDGGPSSTPFATQQLTVDPATGAMAVGTQPERALLVVARNEHRVGWAGAKTLAASPLAKLVEVPVPYRTAWWTTGIAGNGVVDKPAQLHLAPTGQAGARLVELRFALTGLANTAARPTVDGSPVTVDSGSTAGTSIFLCQPATEPVVLDIESGPPVAASAGPPVTPALDRVAVGPVRPGRGCKGR